MFVYLGCGGLLRLTEVASCSAFVLCPLQGLVGLVILETPFSGQKLGIRTSRMGVHIHKHKTASKPVRWTSIKQVSTVPTGPHSQLCVLPYGDHRGKRHFSTLH